MSAATMEKPAETFQAGGTITIPPKCKPSKAVGKDPTRPILNHAYLRRREGKLWLLASDSYCAMALAVEGDAQEGFVPVGVLRHMEAGRKAEQLSPTAWKIATDEGSLVFDIEPVVKTSAEFPKLENLGLWDGENLAGSPAPFEGATIAVGINPDLMKKVSDGLGATGGCRFEFVGPLSAIRVTPIGKFDRHGLQMPIRLNV